MTNSKKHKYVVGEVVILNKPTAGTALKYNGQQVTVIDTFTAQYDSSVLGYEVRAEDGREMVVIEPELTSLDNGGKVEIKPLSPFVVHEDGSVGISIQAPPRKGVVNVTRDNKPVHMIDGEEYELASWGEKLSDGSRWATLRRVER